MEKRPASVFGTVPWIARIGALALIGAILPGCAVGLVGAAVVTTATVAVEVVKVPFKVTGAVVDAVTDDDEDD